MFNFLQYGRSKEHLNAKSLLNRTENDEKVKSEDSIGEASLILYFFEVQLSCQLENLTVLFLDNFSLLVTYFVASNEAFLWT